MANLKLVKSATALVLGASVLTSAVAVSGTDASAKTTYKVTKKGTLVNAKTNKSVKGYKSYKGKLYKNGKKLTGTYKSVFYKSGVKFTGTYNKKYYVKGKLFTGKTSKNVYYKKGVKFTGVTNYGYTYKDGKRVEGQYKGKVYNNGKLVTGVYKGVLYTKGVKETGFDLNQGKLYKDGVLNVGLALHEGKLYKDANLNKGLAQYGDKYYFDANLANSTYDGVTYKDGVKVEAPLKVESATTTNETTITVTFNKDVTAEDAKAIKVLNGTTEVAYTSAVEGKVATLTLEAPFYVGTTLTVEFDGVTQEVTGTVADPELTDVENATNAVVALEEAVKDLQAENIANAEEAVEAANEALKAVDTASVKEDLTNRIAAAEAKIAEAKEAAKLAEQVKAAEDAVAELEAAVAELKDEAAVTAAEAAVTKAEEAVKALPEGNENIEALNTRIKDANAKIVAAKDELASPIKTVGEVADITIVVGETPEFPETVEVTKENGKKGTAAVTWDLEGKTFKTAGTTKVTGTVKGTDTEVEVVVNVETQATFDAALKAIKVDADKDAVTDADFLEILTAPVLNLKNIDEDSIAEYKSAIAAAFADETDEVSEIQAIIDATNQEISTGAETVASKQIEAIKAATTVTALKEALKVTATDGNADFKTFDNVVDNTAAYTAYRTALKAATLEKLADVQKTIDATNLDRVTKAVVAAETAAKADKQSAIDDAQHLLDEVVEIDLDFDEAEGEEKTFQERINAAQTALKDADNLDTAIAAVVDGSTDATKLAALKELDESLVYTAANVDAYNTAFSAISTAKKPTTVEGVQKVISKVDLDTAIAAVVNGSTNATKLTALTALDKSLVYTVANLEAYNTAFSAITAENKPTTVEGVQKVLTKVDADAKKVAVEAALVAVNDLTAESESTDTISVLKDSDLGLTNVVDKNSTLYRAELLKSKPEAKYTKISEVQAVVDAVNATKLGTLNKETVSTKVKAALLNLEDEDVTALFNDLTKEQQTAAIKEIIASEGFVEVSEVVTLLNNISLGIED